MSKFTDAVLKTFAMPLSVAKAIAGAMMGPESHLRTRYAEGYITDSTIARIMQLEEENAALRDIIVQTRTELETALRHLRGC